MEHAVVRRHSALLDPLYSQRQLLATWGGRLAGKAGLGADPLAGP